MNERGNTPEPDDSGPSRTVPPTASFSFRKKLLFSVILIAVLYFAVELLFSALFAHGLILNKSSLWFFEESGRTIHFDPVRGYRLTPVPSRMMRMTYGQREYLGTLRGNSQGFPDRDDFGPGRPDPGTPRIAVFGDSFSAAQYLEQNWPDAVERMSTGAGVPLQLLNFSVDGAGLANWWSILTRIVDREGYEIDALLFAVYSGDLERSFAISDHRGSIQPMYRQIGWNPAKWPKSLAEARQMLKPQNGFTLSKKAFEMVVNGELNPGYPLPYKPYLFPVVKEELALLFADKGKARTPSRSSRESEGEYGFNPYQARMIREMAAFAKRKSIPVIVVRVPGREGLIREEPPGRAVVLFSKILGATFIDGAAPFAGLSESDIRSHWLPHDAHWGQAGSSRFARFMFERLQKEFPEAHAGE